MGRGGRLCPYQGQVQRPCEVSGKQPTAGEGALPAGQLQRRTERCAGPDLCEGSCSVLQTRGLQLPHGAHRSWAGLSVLNSLSSQPAPGPAPAPPPPPAPARPGTLPATPSRTCSRLEVDSCQGKQRAQPRRSPLPPCPGPAPEDTDAKRYRSDTERQQQVPAAEPPLQGALPLGALHLRHMLALLVAEPRFPSGVDPPGELRLSAGPHRRRRFRAER